MRWIKNSTTVEARYNYYRDSDQNRLNRYALAGNFWIDNYKFGVNFRHTDANDPTRDNRAEDLLFRIYSRLTISLAPGRGSVSPSSQIATHPTFLPDIYASTANFSRAQQASTYP